MEIRPGSVLVISPNGSKIVNYPVLVARITTRYPSFHGTKWGFVIWELSHNYFSAYAPNNVCLYYGSDLKQIRENCKNHFPAPNP